MITIFQDSPQILALLSASLTAFSSGSLFAFLSPAIPKLLSEYNFTMEEVSYLPMLSPLAMILGSPFFSRLMDKIGRKYTLLIAGVLHIISWLVTAFAQTIYIFYLSRILYGISDACFFITLPTYIAEISTPRIRGLYGNSITVVSFMGQFSVNCVGFYLNIQLTAFIMLAVSTVFIVTFIFMPDTPYYLIMVGDVDGAKRSLEKLRTCKDINEELNQICHDVQRQMSETGRFKDLWLNENNRKAVFIASIARIFHQLSGFVAIAVYCQYIFQEAGGDISSGAAGMITSGIFAIAIPFGTAFTDKLGRTKSMILSCLCCGIALLSEAIYFYLQVKGVVDLSIINWYPVAGIVVFAISFSAGLGVVPNLLAGEMFSTNIRRHATAVVNIVFGTCICVIAKLFQIMMSNYGLWVPFLLFGLCGLVNSILSYFVIPETKGRTLEEIQQMLKSNKKNSSIKC